MSGLNIAKDNLNLHKISNGEILRSAFKSQDQKRDFHLATTIHLQLILTILISLIKTNFPGISNEGPIL